MLHAGPGMPSPKHLSALLAAIGCSLLLVSCVSTRLQPVLDSPPPVTTRAFAEAMATTGKTPWTEGNSISTHVNGDEFYPVMLEAVRGARRSITFESFVNMRSTPVSQFSLAFAERARVGVKVHLILDAFGSKHFGDDFLDHMRAAGVEIEFYSPFHPLLPYRYNHRTHRRILVVDGETGFTGGAGWTHLWVGNAQVPENWRDTQYRIRGPIVRDLQDCFNDNWKELTGRELSGPDYFPPLARAGRLAAQHVTGSPRKSVDTIGSSYLLAIRAATTSILIEHAYFVPPKPITEALVLAARRGVEIAIIIPGKHTDMPIARNAAGRSYRELLEAGVHLYEYLPTMMHGKLLVVDGSFSSIGSANIDGRSFFINDENNIHVIGASFAREQARMFERDKSRSRQLSVSDLPNGLRDMPLNLFGRGIAGQL